MLTFVSAQETSMAAYLSLSAASRYQGLSRGYADSLLRQGCTRPAWCVVGLEAGVPVARAALWSTPDRSVPTDVVLIEVNWGDRDLADGMALLNQLHERARALGADVLMHSVDAPPGAPQYQEDEEARNPERERAGGLEAARSDFRLRLIGLGLLVLGLAVIARSEWAPLPAGAGS